MGHLAFIAQLKTTWGPEDKDKLQGFVSLGKITEGEAEEIIHYWERTSQPDYQPPDINIDEIVMQSYQNKQKNLRERDILNKDNSTFGERMGKAGKEYAKTYPKALVYRFLGIGIFIAIIYLLAECGA